MSDAFPPYEPSPLAGLSAEEAAQRYLRRVLLARVAYVVGALSLVIIFGIFSAMLSAFKDGIVCIGLLFIICAVSMKSCSTRCSCRIAKAFTQLTLILDQDCDPGKYQKVIGVLATNDPQGRASAALRLERALTG